jgi:MFS family permease
MSRDLKIFALALFTWGVGESMFFIFQPLYLQQLGANPVTIGTILGATGIAMAIAHIPAGHLADRIGRRPLIWTAWFIALAASWLMALARSLPLFIVGLLLYNLTAFVSSPMNSYISAASGKLSTARAITLISSFYNAGAIIGPWLGGQIAARYGLSRIYLTSAAIFILSTGAVILLRPQPIDPVSPDTATKRIKIDPKLILLWIIVFGSMFAMYLPQPLAAVYLQNQRKLAYEQIGQLGSITGLGIVIMNLILGSLTTQMGFLIGQFSVLIFSILLWGDHPFIVYGLAHLFIGGYRVARAFIMDMVRNLVQQSRMGLVFGITDTVISITTILAPPLAGWLYSLEPVSIFRTAAIIIIVSIPASWMMFSWIRRNTPVPAPPNG